MFFDARAAKLLAPGEAMAVPGCPGLRLVATASTRSWVYRFKSPADGRLRQVTLGHWPTMAASAAAAAWQAQREARASGIDPAEQRRAGKAAQAAQQRGPYTVQALVDDFVAGRLRLGRGATSAAAAERALQSLLEAEPVLAAMPAEAVTRAQAFKVLDDRRSVPTATAKLRSLLGSAWGHALDAGRVDGNTPNWWREVMRGGLRSQGKVIGGQHQGRQRRVLQQAEVAQLLAWLPNMHALGRDAVVMYLWTCTRGVEFFGMRPEHLRREPGGLWWQVPKLATKNAAHPLAVDLRVPLFGRALEVVERRLAGVGASGWLFEGWRCGQYTQHDFSTYVYRLQPYSVKVQARQSAGGLVLPVAGWTPHNLRRTARTLLAGLGCPNEVGEAIVGHLPPGIVGTYNAYTYDAERRLWLGRLSGLLESLAPPS